MTKYLLPASISYYSAQADVLVGQIKLIWWVSYSMFKYLTYKATALGVSTNLHYTKPPSLGGHTTSVYNQPTRLTQPPMLNGMENEFQP